MADKQYVYAVARIRSKELSLLSGAFLDQLTAAKDYDECIQLLMEKGWGDDSTASAEELLALEIDFRTGGGCVRIRRVPVRQRLPQPEGSHQGGGQGGTHRP